MRIKISSPFAQNQPQMFFILNFTVDLDQMPYFSQKVVKFLPKIRILQQVLEFEMFFFLLPNNLWWQCQFLFLRRPLLVHLSTLPSNSRAKLCSKLPLVSLVVFCLCFMSCFICNVKHKENIKQIEIIWWYPQQS